jgi:TRAP-type mannitol/chloroaromatic compound transport system substrate-binding protein
MRRILAAATAALACMAIATTANAATKIALQTAMLADSFSLNYLNEVWVPKLEQMTNGALAIEILPSQAVAPHHETPSAVAAGILQGDLNAIAYFTGKDEGFALLGDLIAGYETAEQVQMFCRFGGGRDVLQRIYDKLFPGNIHVVGCGPFAREALVSSVPIRSLEDFEGLRIRAPEGLTAELLARLGAEPAVLPLPDVYDALKRDAIDAADASSYANNSRLGLHDLAKYPLFPGIYSMPVFQFTINRTIWENIGLEGQAALEAWYHAAWTDMTRAAALEDRKAVSRDLASGRGIEVIEWPAAERARLRQIAAEVWAEAATKSEFAQAAYDAHLAFMKEYGLLD